MCEHCKLHNSPLTATKQPIALSGSVARKQPSASPCNVPRVSVGSGATVYCTATGSVWSEPALTGSCVGVTRPFHRHMCFMFH